MPHRSKSLKTVPKSNIPLAQKSLKDAFSDLKSAKTLFDGQCYSHAIYHLQQSHEKSWKSFGFYYGVITEGMARSNDIIGHKGSKVCIHTISALKKIVSHMRVQAKAVNNLKNTGSADQVSVILNEDLLKQSDEGIDFLLKELNNFAANEDKIWNMPYDEMKNYIDSLIMLDQSMDEVEKKLDTPQFREEVCDKIRQGTYRLWRPLVAGNPSGERLLKKIVWEDLTNDMIHDMLKATLCGICVTAPLFTLSVITQVHEQTTRYGINDLSPESIYTASHPMIRLYPQIYTVTETTLSYLERLYAEIPADKLLEEGDPSP